MAGGGYRGSTLEEEAKQVKRGSQSMGFFFMVLQKLLSYLCVLTYHSI
jgi:hypothetical protein